MISGAVKYIDYFVPVEWVTPQSQELLASHFPNEEREFALWHAAVTINELAIWWKERFDRDAEMEPRLSTIYSG